ncbi:hypothetical protein X738_32855 [Mesorhizobium sp. LNHC209A00]|nr:hypothetical protein X738_32855 [Mesorhizobium sp. LNHC209A00]
MQSSDAKKVITVRTASFQAAPEGGSASVETVQAAAVRGALSNGRPYRDKQVAASMMTR